MTAPRMQVLMLSKRLPISDADHAGGKITHYYLQSAVEWSDVDLVALASTAEALDGLPAIRSAHVIRTADLSTTDAASVRGAVARIRGYIRLGHKAASLIRRKYYDLAILERASLAWLTPLFKILNNDLPVIVVVHDLWTDRLTSELERSYGLRRMILMLLRSIARSLEYLGLRYANGIICFDKRTHELITILTERFTASVLVLPPLYDVWPVSRRSHGRIVFYGNMARSVNWKSACWFIDHVLPALRAKAKNVVFHVVGANPPDQLLDRADGQTVVVTGYVTSPGDELAKSSIFVAPLVGGSGIKIKVIEAMASGLPVIGNSIALQGISATPELDYLHAETADDFVSQILRLLNEAALGERIAKNARKLVSDTMNLDQSGDMQRKFYEVVANVSRINTKGSSVARLQKHND